MLPVAGQTAGPNRLNFLVETHDGAQFKVGHHMTPGKVFVFVLKCIHRENVYD